MTGTGKDWTWADIHGTDDKRDIGMDKRDGHRLNMMEDGIIVKDGTWNMDTRDNYIDMNRTGLDMDGTGDKRDIGMDKRDGHRLDMMEDG